MDRGKKKIKIEAHNDLESRLDVLEKIQGGLRFAAFDTFENESVKLRDSMTADSMSNNVKIKAEAYAEIFGDHNSFDICEKDQIIADLNNKLMELRNEALEKDQMVGSYHERLHGFETKVSKMEKEIEELKLQKCDDSQIMEGLRRKLSDSEMREGELRGKNLEASHTLEQLNRKVMAVEAQRIKTDEDMKKNNQTVEELRRQLSVCEERKKMSDRAVEEMKKKEMDNLGYMEDLKSQYSEACKDFEELRGQKSEAERAVEEMEDKLLKADNTVNELRQRVDELKEKNLTACRAAEVHVKRFRNLVPITEELGKLLKMNVDDLVGLKNKLVGAEGEENPVKAMHSICNSVEKGCSGFQERADGDIIEINDSDDETEMICDKFVRGNLSNQTNKQNGINCSDFSFISPKRKRSNLGINGRQANYQPLLQNCDRFNDMTFAHNLHNEKLEKIWRFGADMRKAFQEDDELCLHAVCALYRKQVSASKQTDGSTTLSYHFEKMSGRALAEYLIDGDPKLRLKKSVLEVQQLSPDIINQCRKLATFDYENLFVLYCKGEDPYFGSR